MDTVKLMKWPQVQTLVTKIKLLISNKVDAINKSIKAITDDYLKASDKTELQNAINGKAAKATTLAGYGITDGVNTNKLGVANGVATLDGDGKVPSSQLPSYVDDVLEYDDKASFPKTGESGKIYVDLSNNLTYRWGGTAYTEISKSLALGETASTAYAGNKGKANADAIAILNGASSVTGSVANKVAAGVASANGYTDTELAKFTYATDDEITALFPELLA